MTFLHQGDEDAQLSLNKLLQPLEKLYKRRFSGYSEKFDHTTTTNWAEINILSLIFIIDAVIY